MNHLKQYGINKGSKEDGNAVREGQVLSPQRFFTESGQLLRSIAPAVLNEVVPNLRDYDARYSTGGFMVFPLGQHALGSVRLHVWPADIPRRSPIGPSIHNHAFHMSSLIMKGMYKDSMYALAAQDPGSPEDEDASYEKLTLFESAVDPLANHGLTTDGANVRAILLERRTRQSGTGHTMLAGEYHLPQIPGDQLASTVVCMSPDIRSGINVALPPEMMAGAVDLAQHRQSIDEAAVLAVQHVLMSE
jgi:hypothetical protein